jgi:hypothetical protein
MRDVDSMKANRTLKMLATAPIAMMVAIRGRPATLKASVTGEGVLSSA